MYRPQEASRRDALPQILTPSSIALDELFDAFWTHFLILCLFFRRLIPGIPTIHCTMRVTIWLTFAAFLSFYNMIWKIFFGRFSSEGFFYVVFFLMRFESHENKINYFDHINPYLTVCGWRFDVMIITLYVVPKKHFLKIFL